MVHLFPMRIFLAFWQGFGFLEEAYLKHKYFSARLNKGY